MSFSHNLRMLREEKKLSQEQFAELLSVSKQAVSKWEQDDGYPETKKIIQIAKEFNISLDSLLLGKGTAVNTENSSASSSGKITIYCGKQLRTCIGFFIVAQAFARKSRPQRTLVGVTGTSGWGDSSVIIGEYATEEDATRELAEIKAAMQNGEKTYNLKYAMDV